VSTLLFSILLCPAAPHQPDPELLTIGSPAPPLRQLTFLRGDSVRELSRGTVYVVEFAGTECASCTRCIPRLNALHGKRPGVVLVSVYCEDAKAVRAFLAGKGKDISFPVAADPSGAARRAWSDAAWQVGIPHAFIVGKDGRIAWIGDPEDMDRPLAEIVAGKFDTGEDAVRLKIEQEAARRLRRAEEREEKGERECERINGLILAGELATALADTEKALAEYQGCPQATALLRDARIYLLANIPGKREEAFRAATELAIDVKVSGRSTDASNTAVTLLDAVAAQAPGSRDRRLVDLALALLRDLDPEDLRGKPGDALRDYQIDRLRLVGQAFHLRGDSARACAAIREALAKVRDLKAATGKNEARFAQGNAGRLCELQAALKEYSGQVLPAPKDRP
jgi:tetratricopeptide (TPR) repeat protein